MFTLITGASSGIGKALALECAAHGMHLLLAALPGTELEELAFYICKQYGVHCHVLGIDLSAPQASSRVYAWVKEQGFRVNILINNVGVGSKGPFEKITREFYQKQLHLNMGAATLLMHHFIPELQANAPSRILNVGSMGGFYPLPGKAVYSASKAYVHHLSKALRLELAPLGITVSMLCPGGTDSNPNTIAINNELKGFARWSILQPEQVAKEGIAQMLKGKARIIPGWHNRFYFHLSHLIPEYLINNIIRKTFKQVAAHEY